MLLDGYLSTLQFMKLTRLANILKNKPTAIHIQKWMWPYENNEVNLLHLSTKLCLHYEKSFTANDFPRDVTETKLPAINLCVFLQLMQSCKMWGILCPHKPVAVTHWKWQWQNASGLGPTHQARAKGCSADLAGHDNVSQKTIKMQAKGRRKFSPERNVWESQNGSRTRCPL